MRGRCPSPHLPLSFGLEHPRRSPEARRAGLLPWVKTILPTGTYEVIDDCTAPFYTLPHQSVSGGKLTFWCDVTYEIHSGLSLGGCRTMDDYTVSAFGRRLIDATRLPVTQARG